ncbi:MAG: hypothetical protein WC686_00530 [Candidatus Shapirobacteria bacterium]|jgi:hypothetical protein
MPISSFSQSKPLYEFLRKQQDNEKFNRGLEITGTFILISFFLFFAIKPTAYTISSLLGDIRSKEELIKKMRTKINTVIQAQESFSLIQGKYRLVDSSLPDSARFNQAYTQVTGSLQSSGLNQSKIPFSLPLNSSYPASSHVSVFASNLALDASFSQAVNFINKLTNNRRLVDIKSISFFRPSIGSGTDSSSGTIKVNFGIEYLYWDSTSNEKK